MSLWLTELLSNWTALVFVLSGLLLAGCRAGRLRMRGAGRHIDVDPDIRVRVTGKIS